MPLPRKPRNRSSTESYTNNDLGSSQQHTDTNNTNMNPIKIVVSGIALLIALVLMVVSFKIVTIQGNQLGVKETWSNGVEETILQPKTYFLFPGWSQTVYKYDASSQVFVMNDKPSHLEGKNSIGREKDAYLVQSQEGQDMHISLNLRWRIDPTKLVSIHWENLLDYTLGDLRLHLEKQFTPGMTWETYGLRGWHIDNIIPISSFNITSYDCDDFRKCWTLSNLQPMWWDENMSKGNRKEPYLKHIIS